MQDAFGIVIFAVVRHSAVLAIGTLFDRGKLYDEIGRGGIGDDRDGERDQRHHDQHDEERIVHPGR